MSGIKKDWTDAVSESMDTEWTFSIREMINRVFLHAKVVTVCAVMVPTLALGLTYLLPANYKSSAKVLIKYDDTGSSFFSEIAAPRGQIVSGQGNAELLRSVTVCAKVVETLSLQASDIKRPALEVIVSRLIQACRHVFKPGAAPVPGERDITQLAKELKESIKATTIQKPHADLRVSDELIEVTVESPSSRLVAPITREVCLQFIDEYFRRYVAEAQKAYDYLTKQVELASSLPAGASGGNAASAWGDTRINSNPIVESAARQVASLELEVARLSNIYNAGAPELAKTQADLERARAILAKFEKSETSRAVLSMLKDKQQQALMTLQLYQNRLIPVSIVEMPVAPRVSTTGTIFRYVLAGGAGGVLGISLGITMALFLAALDRRLYTPWDCERTSGLDLAGSVPRVARLANGAPELSDPPIPEFSRAIVSILGAMDIAGGGKVITVTSPSRKEGKTLFIVEMAKAMLHGARQRVLLIDGGFLTQGLSRLFGRANTPGIIEVLAGEVSIEEVVKPSSLPGLDLMPSGNLEDRLKLGYYRNALCDLLAALRERYDLILIDTDGILNSPDAVLLASTAERVLTVVRYGTTRHETLSQALRQLARLGVKPFGLLLNGRRFPVPSFFYG
ncbi:hypothetical protein JCM15519_20560 [Fundidesulfovibrio butyratiphilus]